MHVKRVCAVHGNPQNINKTSIGQDKTLDPLHEEEPTQEQIQADSDAVQEAPKIASAPTPYTPTQAEREAHEISHWPYRAWCQFCVQ